MKTVKEYINLLPRKEKSPVRILSVWSLGGVLFLALWLVLFGVKAKQWWDVQAKLRMLEPQQTAREQELATMRKSLGLTAGGGSEQTALIQSLLKERVLWSEVFQQFARIIPRGVWFDGLEGSSVNKPEIRIRGGAFNYRLISDFMLAMEQTGYFDKPELMFAQKAMVQGHDVVGFEIRCGVKKAQGGH
jgi:Tfp pilus assembly protein PilN